MVSGIARYGRESNGKLSIRPAQMFPTAEAIKRLSEMRQASFFYSGRKWGVEVGRTIFWFGRRADAEFEAAANQSAWLI